MKKRGRKKRGRKKRAYTVMRFRENSPGHNLLAAAQHWAISHNSWPVMMGDITLIRQGEYKFQICVGMMGKEPGKKRSVNSPRTDNEKTHTNPLK